MNDLSLLRDEMQKTASPARAKNLSWFFKTGKGQYGEGDVFCGLTVPQSRIIAGHFPSLSLKRIESLLKSPTHEERLIALFILVSQFSKADEDEKKKIVDFYLSHADRVNNWDLVDSSADKILGEWLLLHPDENLIQKLATSSLLWERRIAMVSTFAFIKKGKPELTFLVARMLLADKEDLIHKATGWMLREVGKRCGREKLIKFLSTSYKFMPRTALRYSIEHFPPQERKRYLQGLV